MTDHAHSNSAVEGERTAGSGMRQLASDAIVESTIEATLESIPLPCGLRRLLEDDVVHVRDNAASARFFGRTVAEMQGRTGRQLGLSPTRIGSYVATLKLASRERLTVRLQVRHQTPSGARDIVYYATPLSFDASRFICVTEDVTDLKRVESEAVHAERLAMVGTLMAALVHDMAGPATVAMLRLDSILQSVKAPDSSSSSAHAQSLQQDLLVAREGLAQVIGILRSVRSYTQSQGETETAPCDLNDVVDTALRLAGTELRASARFKFQRGTIPCVLGSAIRLGQVVLNLITNAARAASLRHEPSSARVTIRTLALPDGRVSLDVIDNGAGLPTDQTRLFQPFATRFPHEGGTGLGLFISKRIIESVGGTIELVNHGDAVRTGTRATLFLLPSRDLT